MGSDNVKPKALRQLLADLLRSDTDFEAFCLDHFPDVYQRFGNGMERLQKENLLLVHAPSWREVILALRMRFPMAEVWRKDEEANVLKTAGRPRALMTSCPGCLAPCDISMAKWTGGYSAGARCFGQDARGPSQRLWCALAG